MARSVNATCGVNFHQTGTRRVVMSVRQAPASTLFVLVALPFHCEAEGMVSECVLLPSVSCRVCVWACPLLANAILYKAAAPFVG